MSKEIIKYFFVRFLILIIPIVILILGLLYAPKNNVSPPKGYSDAGFGIAVMGGAWLQLYFLIMLYQMIFNIFKKNNLWKANLAIMAIIIIPILRYLFLMGAFS